ncbi:MAG: hypothetical protein AB7K36_21115 [Chloroflexota bacterium]
MHPVNEIEFMRTAIEERQREAAADRLAAAAVTNRPVPAGLLARLVGLVRTAVFLARAGRRRRSRRPEYAV